MFSHKYVVLVAAGEKHEGLQKRLSRNEVAEFSEAELIRLIHIQLGTPGSRSVDSRVHESDGSPHGVILLLGRERTEIRPSRSKDAGEEVVWWLSPNSICPGKSPRPNGIVIPIGWKYMARPTVKIIYAPNMRSSFFYTLRRAVVVVKEVPRKKL